MTLSTRMKATGQKLLEKYGQSITFTRVTEGDFNPMTGDTEPSVTTTFSAYGSPIPFTQSEIDGTLIQQQDRQIWLEINDNSSVPVIGDAATISGTAYRVLNVNSYVVQGLTVLYRLQVRI